METIRTTWRTTFRERDPGSTSAVPEKVLIDDLGLSVAGEPVALSVLVDGGGVVVVWSCWVGWELGV